MKRRTPTPDELRLWAEVAKSVAPLGDRVPVVAEAAPIAAPAPAPSRGPPTPQPARAAPARATAAPTTIDRRTVSRLSRGALAIDARLDLHGMT